MEHSERRAARNWHELGSTERLLRQSFQSLRRPDGDGNARMAETPRGLGHVDFETQRRTAKLSVSFYRDVIVRNAIGV